MQARNTIVLMQFDNADVRKVNFALPKVQKSKVCTNSYSLARSMMTVFSWLYKFTSVPFGYVCVQISRT
jgi:hypothetical protein